MAARTAPVTRRTDDLPDAHKLQAQFALAAFATIKTKELAYVSIPITSGRRLYDYMEANGFMTAKEAKADHAAFFKNVVSPNFDAGLRASAEWAEKLDGAVIAPVEFEKHLRTHNAVDWDQDDFMGMWIPLIEQKITQMVMIDGWEYSNGSGEEYLQAALMQMGRGKRSDIDITDVRGKTLPLDAGIKLLADAFIGLAEKGIKARNMAETLALVLEAEERFHRESTTGRSAEPAGTPVRKEAKPAVAPYSHDDVAAIAVKARKILARDYPDILPTLKRISSYDFSPINSLFKDEKTAPPKPSLPVLAA
ncbi:MAG: hypothetical protein ACAH83_15625 [Alphaproteobacteria bacterium]